MGVVGAAIKGFGKALKVGKRNKASKQVFKNPKYKPSQKALKETMSKGVVDRNVKSKEVFKTIQGLRKKPSKLKKVLKDQRTKGLATGAVIGGAYKLGEEKGKGKK